MELTLAIYFYDVNDHPAGFVGWRVAVSMGKNNTLKQVYYSLKSYPPRIAEHLAREKEKELRLEAELNKIKWGTPTGREGKTIVLRLAPGFGFRVARNAPGSWVMGYVINSRKNGGKSVQRSFNINNGIHSAFEKALDAYAELKALDDVAYYELWKSEPSLAELVDYVREYLPDIYPDFPTEEIMKRLLDGAKRDA